MLVALLHCFQNKDLPCRLEKHRNASEVLPLLPGWPFRKQHHWLLHFMVCLISTNAWSVALPWRENINFFPEESNFGVGVKTFCRSTSTSSFSFYTGKVLRWQCAGMVVLQSLLVKRESVLVGGSTCLHNALAKLL